MRNFIFVSTVALVALPWLSGCTIHSSGKASSESTTVVHSRSGNHEGKESKESQDGKPAHAHADAKTVSEESRPAAPKKAETKTASQAEAVTPPCGCGVAAPAVSEAPAVKTHDAATSAPAAPAATTKKEAAKPKAAASTVSVSAGTKAEPGTAGASATVAAKPAESGDAEKGAKPAAKKPDSTTSKTSNTLAARHELRELAAKGSKTLKGSSETANEKKLGCTLSVKEAPRGGKIDLRGQGFGSTPMVRIGGKVVKMLERGSSEVSVQVPTDSNGGVVTITIAGVTVTCGRLEIIGKNR